MSDITHDVNKPSMFRWRTALDVLTTVAMLVAAVVVVWHTLARPVAPAAAPARPAPPVPTELLSIDAQTTQGSAEARAAMIIFSDFECPFCATFSNETLPSIREQYVNTGKVRLAFRHLPLPFHSRALPAATSAECAARQGKFWAMHDSLFQPPMRLQQADLDLHARAAALDIPRFVACMAGEGTDRVTADSLLAQELRLTGTPSFVVGVTVQNGNVRATEVFSGAQPFNVFAEAFERALGNE